MAALLFALGWFGMEAFEPGAGYVGLILAGIVWLIMTLIAYFSGDHIFLAMSGAKKIQKSDLPVLWNVVEEMSIASGLGKMPAVYVIDDQAPNAFATGRSAETASVAVTNGLLRLCSRDELQGVIAHEIGHIRNRDILLMLYAGVLVGAVAMLAEVGLRAFWYTGGGRSRRSNEGGGQGQAIIFIIAIVLMILAPLIAQLIYFAVSRRREYLADASSAVYTRYPEGLASALEKLAGAPAKLASANRVTAPMYIVNPVQRRGMLPADATSTHPPISRRVKILRSMAGVSFAEYEKIYRQLNKGRSVLPPSALGLAGLEARRAPAVPGAAEPTAPLAAEPTGPAPARPAAESLPDRAREIDNFFYRHKDYRVLKCPCGAVLKIPPGFLGTEVKCPHCGRRHQTSLFGELGVRSDRS
jgi:heat shock protein HtpX